MKRFFKLNVSLLFCLGIFTACPEVDYKNLVNIKNNSEHYITTYIGVISSEYGGSLYPDTLLPPIKVGIEIKPHSDRSYTYNYNYSKNKFDTICIFIWNTELASDVPWDSIRLKNKIIQRYDISYKDLENLKWKISYPPSSEMENIKMFPPYK